MQQCGVCDEIWIVVEGLLASGRSVHLLSELGLVDPYRSAEVELRSPRSRS